MKLFKRFIKDEKGLETPEYAIMLALIALALIGAIGFLSGSIGNAFNAAGNLVTNPTP